MDPESDPEKFSQIWPDLASNETSQVAYRLMELAGALRVYYSSAFEPFREQMEKLKTKPRLASIFREQYEVWIGYHGIMQWREKAGSDVDSDDKRFEDLRERERATVAAVQVKQALMIAELQRHAFKQAETES